MKFAARLLILTALLGMSWSLPAKADTPAQSMVRTFYSKLVATMKEGETLGFSGRHKQLAPAIQTAFNLPLMARMSMGPGWAKANDKERKELIEAFSDYSISTYANRFASYDGEEFTVTGEKPLGKDTVVETTLKPKDGAAVTLNYLVKKDGKGAPRIMDVYLNGTISELATRRSEYSSIVRQKGIESLIASLKAKAKQLAVEP
ncbi:MAG: ABC transporter substrate-binding protein [Alphaproteobacteria bacterium]|nr:ABC transporter substrate-binding protein [Alphaproteobacteria bacterium]